MKFRLALATLLLTLSTPLLAGAEQPWVEDPDIGEGEGIPVGNLEFHPSLAGEFGYDSNYLRRGPGDLDANGDELPVVESLRLRITPSFTLNTQRQMRHEDGAPPLFKLRLDTGVSASYSVFIPLDDTDEFDDRNRLGGGVGARFELFPQRPITWDVHANYQRTIDPSSVATGDFDFDRHNLKAGTGVTWRPGGGLFEWRVGYDWSGTFFSEGDYDVFNNGQHTIGTRGRWRFLPRTALLYDGHYRFIRYTDTGATQTQTDGELIQSRLGVAGLITTRFAFRAMGGWAASFFKPRNGIDPQNFDGPVGNAEIKWFVSPSPSDSPDSASIHLSSVALGYDHGYSHSYLGPFYTQDRGYLTFKYFIGTLIVTSLQGYVAYITYPDFLGPTGEIETDVTETRVGARLFAEYRAAANVGINTTLSYDQNISDDVFAVGDPNPDPTPGNPMPEPDFSQEGLEFRRFQAFAGVRVFW